MLAVLAFVAFVVAGILELTKTHLNVVIWLVIIGGALVAAEVIWGWNRTGRYSRTGV
jgi:hypothetical protein